MPDNARLSTVAASIVVGLLASMSPAGVSLHVEPNVLSTDDGVQVLYVVMTSTPGTDAWLGSISFAFDIGGEAWVALAPSAFAWVPDVMNNPAAWFVIDDLPDPIAVAFSPGAAVPVPDGVKVTIAALTVTPNTAGVYSFTLGVDNLTDELAVPLPLDGGDPATVTVIIGASDCCAPHSGVGCVTPAVETCVCAILPACCSSGWSCDCVALAATTCGICTGDDCNANQVPDRCDIALGTHDDCNTNGVPDVCDTPPICPTCADCNGNLVPDACDLFICAGGGPSGSTWVETSDAGSLPDDAQIVTGHGALQHITGTVGADGVDMYAIAVTDPTAFSAWTSGDQGGLGGSASFDTALWLFAADGTGVVANDDNPGPLLFHSGMTVPADDGTGAAPAGPGLHYLAVSGFGHDPVSSTGAVFDAITFTETSGPDGPGGSWPITDWVGGGPSGSYDIFLTGAAYVPDSPAPCDCNANGRPDDCDIADGSSFDDNVNGVPDECEIPCAADGDCDDGSLCTVDRCGLDSVCIGQGVVFGDINNDGATSADDVNCILDCISGQPATLACCDRSLGSCSGPADTLPSVGFQNKDVAPCLGCPRVGVDPDVYDCGIDCSITPCASGLVCITLAGGARICRDPSNMGDGFISADDLNAVLDAVGGAVPNDSVMPACLACGNP